MVEDRKSTAKLKRDKAVRLLTDRLPVTGDIGSGWRLKVMIGEQSTVFDIDFNNDMLVGRSANADDKQPLALDLAEFGGYERGVSRIHARIFIRESTIYIMDNDSTNGSKVNHYKMMPGREYILRDGDHVVFGDLEVSFHYVRPTRPLENP